MKKEYSYKEADNLIRKYENVLERLESSRDEPIKYKGKIQNDIETLLGNYYFQSIEINDLNKKEITEIKSKEDFFLIKDMYCYIESSKMANTCKNLYKNNYIEINEEIEKLLKVDNFFKRTFSNKEKKMNADSAYEKLNNGLNGDFYKYSIKTLDILDNLGSSDEKIIYKNFSENKEKYNNLFFSLFPNINEHGYNIKEIERLIKKYNNITDNVIRSDIDMNNVNKKIIDSLNSLIANELLETLREIPIEELNREKAGLPVKTLKEAGYNNIADVYSSSESQLASIPRVSSSAAAVIKMVTENIEKQARKIEKIKLNVDNKNKYSDKVVLWIYIYKQKNDIINAIKSLYKENDDTIETYIKDIKEIINGVRYYYSDNERKEYYIEIYNWLKEILYGENYGKKLQELFAKFNAVNNVTSNDAWNDFEKDSISYFNVIEKVNPGVLGNDDTLYGLPEKMAKEIQNESFFPDGLLCTLRRYQELGVKYILHQGNVLLGDEMGLGKTIQAIATMVSLRNTGATHFAVVCPASVLTNWCREIINHSKLKPTEIHGRNRKKAFQSWLETGGVAVTTYETVGNFEFDKDFMFDLLVVDEAHYIKNPLAKRTINTIKFGEHAKRKLFMTGTALENKVDEMVNLVRILNPKIAEQIQGMSYMSSAPAFREKVAPVYYRRKREDVLTELPELIESKEWCNMSKYEEESYENTVLTGSYPEIRRLSWNLENIEESSKANRLKEIIEEAKNENRKVIVFSFFLKTIDVISKLLGDRCVGIINGSITPEKRQEIIDEFDKAKDGSVLLAQITSGGTGLNIQSASVVVICEPQFKPSIENQAISRAYRMGQIRNVLVYRLLCVNTIDEKITDLLEQKQKIFDEFADKSVAAEGEKSLGISDKAFGNIIKEEIDRINEKREKEKRTNSNNDTN